MKGKNDMSSMRVMNPRIKWFIKQMQSKLRIPKNQAKRDPRTCKRQYLLALLKNEVVELEGELVRGTPETVREACADIANYAMMLADHTRQWRTI